MDTVVLRIECRMEFHSVGDGGPVRQNLDASETMPVTSF